MGQTRSKIDSLNIFEIDSIKIELVNAKGPDSAKIYNKIVWKLRNTKPLAATEYGKKSVELALKYEDYNELAKAYGFLGVAYRNAGIFDEAIVYYKLGLEIAKTYNLQEQLGYAYINLANWYTYSEAKENYTVAVSYLKKAEKIAASLNKNRMLGYCKLNLGRTYLLLSDTYEALSYLNQALEIRIKNKNISGQAVCNKLIADVYNSQRDYKASLYYYEKALNLSNKKFETDQLADIYDKKANIFLKNNKIDKAVKIAQKGLDLALKTKNPARIRHAYSTLAEVMYKMGNNERAYQYQKLNEKYTKEWYDTRLKMKISNVKYIVKEKKDNEAIKILEENSKFQKNEIKQQKTLRWALVVIILLVSSGFVVIYSWYNKNKKRNKLLTSQKNEIEAQRDEINIQHNAIEKQQRQITDSILYAQRIQVATLPEKFEIAEVFPYHFILYKPRDIVSGDFYWFKKTDNKVIIAVADCTGHGVPGAFVSMLGISLLNEITAENENLKSNEILEALRHLIKNSLHQSLGNDSQSDGMDMALTIIDPEKLTVDFSGANNPLYLIRNNELKVYNPTYNPVGIYIKEFPFVSNEIQLKKNDTIYMFSDGYVDQFGGPRDRKFMTSQFRKLLLEIQKYPVQTQKNLLEKKFIQWKGKRKQVDDVLVMGIKIV